MRFSRGLKVLKGSQRFSKFKVYTRYVLSIGCFLGFGFCHHGRGHYDLDVQIGKSIQPTTGWDSQPRASGRIASIVQRVKYSINSALRVSALQCIIWGLEILSSLGAQLGLLMRQGWCFDTPSNLDASNPGKGRPGTLYSQCIIQVASHFCVCTDVLVYQIPRDVQHSATTALTVLCTHSPT